MKLRCADSALWSVTHGCGDVRPGVARAGIAPRPTPARSGRPACRYRASRGRRPSRGPRARARVPRTRWPPSAGARRAAPPRVPLESEQPLRVVFADDVAMQGDPLEHRVGEVGADVGIVRASVAADRPAQHDAAVVLHHGQRKRELAAADVVEENVDALARGLPQTLREGGVAVVDGDVGTEQLLRRDRLRRYPPAMATTCAPAALASWTATPPTAPAALTSTVVSPGLRRGSRRRRSRPSCPGR